MKIILLFSYIIILSTNFYPTINAQTFPGARQISLAHSDVALSNDVFSIFNNPAGLAQIRNREFGIFYSPSPFGIKELANGYLAYLEPTKIVNLSFGAMSYGFNLYKENQFTIGFSKQVTDNVYLGFASKYHTVSILNYGNASTFNFSFGGLFRLNEEFSIGFSLNNPLRLSNSHISLPTIYALGISYLPIENGSINLALLKEIEFPFSVRFGVEYPLIKFLFLRVGISNEPVFYNLGMGIFYSFLKIDYTLSSHQVLGLTHQLGIIINFN